MNPEEKAVFEKQLNHSKFLLVEKKRDLSETEIERRILDRFLKIKWNMKLPEKLMDRFKPLERNSLINEYAEMVSNGAGNILIERSKDKKIELPEWKLLITKLAGLIHDVGKSGPSGANPEQQLAVVKLFSIEALGIAEKDIESVVRENFGEEADQMISSLEECGLKASMPMREFWDMHIIWGHEILEGFKEQLPLEAIRIASLHHAYKDLGNRKFNPLIDETPEEDMPIADILERASILGILEEYLLVVVFDQYEAFVHRGGLKHKEAIKEVRSRIPEKFRAQYPLIDEILDKMEGMDEKEAVRIFEERRNNL